MRPRRTVWFLSYRWQVGRTQCIGKSFWAEFRGGLEFINRRLPSWRRAVGPARVQKASWGWQERNPVKHANTVAVVFASTLVGCAGTPGSGPTEPPQQIYSSAYCDPAIRSNRATQISTPRAYADFWSRLSAGRLAPLEMPSVNFNLHRVIAVEIGQRSSAGYSIELESYSHGTRDAPMRLQLVERKPPSDSLTAQVLTSPCLLLQIDMPAGEVEVVLGENMWLLGD